MATWFERERMVMAKTPYPGVCKLKEGGFYVRAKVRNGRTGQTCEVKKVLREEVPDAASASTWLRAEVMRVKAGEQATSSRTNFGDYGILLFGRKVEIGEIKSAKGREKWDDILKHHLIPAFGPIFFDALRRSDIEDWKGKLGKKIAADKMSPNTANTILSVLKVIINTGVGEFELERNPIIGVKPFDTSDHRTYTDEEPNSLTPEHVPVFLDELMASYPQFYAMTFLGFATGLRPSSMRPLRRHGNSADVKWDEGVLLVRRSQTRGDEVMEKTKTSKDQTIYLPKSLMDVLDWHVGTLVKKQAMSDLLFPSDIGGFRAPSCLDKPFADVVEAINKRHEADPVKHPVSIPYKVTPRAMRRTFNDLARAAKVEDLIVRSISGHATEAMRRRYSTVQPDEQRNGLAKVIELAGARRAAGG